MNGYIEIVSGTLGGGKSMYAVEEGYKHLKKGGFWYTNIEVHPEMVAEQMRFEGLIFDPQRLVRLDGKTIRGFIDQIKRGTSKSPVMVTLDEAHLEWNARDYQSTRKNEGDRDMLNFITMVRKLDIILYFITQSAEDIDKQLRKKAAYMTLCRNFKGFRFLNMIPCPIPIMSRTRWDISVGNSKPIRLWGNFFFRQKWVSEMYNSDALLGACADRFEALQTVEGEPLKRYFPEKPGLNFKEALFACFSASFVASLF